MAEEEPIIDCGCLDRLGFLLGEHRFCCVTPQRVCSLMIKRGGRRTFSSGCLAHINSQTFYQPSLIPLWILITLVALSGFGIGLLLTLWGVRLYGKYNRFGMEFSLAERTRIHVFAERGSFRNAQSAAIAIG